MQLIPGINEPERKTDQNVSAVAEIKNAWNFTSTDSFFLSFFFKLSGMVLLQNRFYVFYIYLLWVCGGTVG